MALLVRWLREDILAVAGPDHTAPAALEDWVVIKWQARAPQCAHRIQAVRTLLANQLGYAMLDKEFRGQSTQTPLPEPQRGYRPVTSTPASASPAPPQV